MPLFKQNHRLKAFSHTKMSVNRIEMKWQWPEMLKTHLNCSNKIVIKIMLFLMQKYIKKCAWLLNYFFFLLLFSVINGKCCYLFLYIYIHI